MTDNDIQFSWNAGYKAGVRDCQLIIVDAIAKNHLRNANAENYRRGLEDVRNAIRLMLENWEENGK